MDMDIEAVDQCQILVISASQELARETVQKIIPSPGAAPPDTVYDNDDRISWTISNKYYTAPVYFLLQKLSLPPAKPLWPPEVDDVHAPAILFVFDKRQLNRELFASLLPAFEAHGAEVRLALGVEGPDGLSKAVSPYDREGKQEDDLEAFFMNHDFEYVDTQASESREEGDDGHYDVVGIPRVIESLSTIMWPSMVRKPSNRPAFDFGLFPNEDEINDTADENEREAAAMYEDLSSSSPRPDSPHPPLDSFEAKLALESHHAVARSESAALEAWLNDDEPHGTPPRGDDDFADFIVASGESKAWPTQFGDLIEVPAGYDELEDDEDDELPSVTEVVQTHARIFGPPRPPPSEPLEEENEPENSFDLTSALSALQVMKEEIAGMTDERERRRAAARVALGLVHGLDMEGEDENEMFNELVDKTNS